MDTVVPFNKASFHGREKEYLQAVLASGRISGDGPFTQACHRFLEKRLGVARALLTTSCTHALDMAAMLADISDGDEVILPSFTFVSTANAFVLRGARPVFIDVRPDTLNLDERLLEGLITPKTRAVAVVHYAGIGAEMDPIMAAAGRHGIRVIEDNAHGLFGRYRGKPLGTFGALATLSFHETKNLSAGEGGALLINDPALAERAEIMREKGTNRAQFFRGEVDKYTWVDIGSSYLPSELVAAVLLAQFEESDRIQQRRREIWDRYHAALLPWAAKRGVLLPTVPPHCEQAHHMFYMLLPDEAVRTALAAYLRERGIAAVSHYVPLHLSPMGIRHGGHTGACPVTEDVALRLLRLPFYNDLTEEQQSLVIDAVTSFNMA